MTDIIEQPVAVRGTPRTKAPEPALSDNAIRGERYWTPEFARQEEEALWPRVWQVAGRVDQIPEPGDYVTYEIGRDSVIAVRGLDEVGARLLQRVPTPRQSPRHRRGRHAARAASSSAPTTAGGSASTAG